MTFGADAAKIIKFIAPLIALTVRHPGKFTFLIVVILRRRTERVGHGEQPVKSTVGKGAGVPGGIGDCGQVAFNIVSKTRGGAIFIDHLRRVRMMVIVTPAADLFVVTLAFNQPPVHIVTECHAVTGGRVDAPEQAVSVVLITGDAAIGRGFAGALARFGIAVMPLAAIGVGDGGDIALLVVLIQPARPVRRGVARQPAVLIVLIHMQLSVRLRDFGDIAVIIVAVGGGFPGGIGFTDQ
ncbi:hypothetical protein VIAE108258_21375 [Vibrio aerogenes]